jgi:hypothetical protein
MTNNEFRKHIYAWLNNNFKITFKDITKQQSKDLKKIVEEFNPTQPQPKVAEKKEYINTSGKTQVWRNF